MKKTLLYVWQLPQHLVALLILTISQNEWRIEGECNYKCTHNNWAMKKFFNSGISLGDYIILDDVFEHDSITLKHEKGHSIQSRYFGPLYLLLIGLPSLCLNIWSRIFNKDAKWYYSKYPEKWADILGKVNRTF